MALLLLVLLGTAAMLAGFGYATRGHIVLKMMQARGLSEPDGFGRTFAIHVHSKARRAVYFTFFISTPFISFYLWEWIFEPEFLGSAFLMSLPWLFLMWFLSLTLPFRIESMTSFEPVSMEDDMNE